MSINSSQPISSSNLPLIDHAALRTNQAFIIGLIILAFIMNQDWLVILIMGVMAWGTLQKKPGFGFVYHQVLKPLGWVKPDQIPDHPEPHRFAQGFGAVVMGAAVLVLWFGPGSLGWGLAWLVAALAALNLFGGICVGCAMYYWLHRLEVPGFVLRSGESSAAAGGQQ